MVISDVLFGRISIVFKILFDSFTSRHVSVEDELIRYALVMSTKFSSTNVEASLPQGSKITP